jgi:integrase
VNIVQNGNLMEDHNAWYLRYYEGKKRKKIWLGRKLDYPTKRHIRPRLEEERARLRLGGEDMCISLESYILTKFLPDQEGRLRPSTIAGYKGLYERYVKDRYEAGARLWLMTPEHVQRLLEAVATSAKKPLAKTTISHFKAFLSRVFNHARNRGFYRGENPVTGTEIPSRTVPSRETGLYTLAEIRLVLPELELAHRAAFAIAAYAGLRLAEIQGLSWPDYDGDDLSVNETEWRGHRSPPKSAASKSFVPVIKPLRDILEEYRATTSGEGPIFTESLDHVGRRQVLWAMKRVKLRWTGWHSARRGIASNLFELGVSDKVVQRILRHSRVTITRDRYIKTRDPLVTAAMNKLEKAVNRPAIQARDTASKGQVSC